MNTGFTPSRDNLSFVIGSLARQPFSLRMTGHYRGLELKQEVRVLEANQRQAVFQASDLPACAILDGDVHLTSRIFPNPVCARVINRNVTRGLLELSDFNFSPAKWIERSSERVHPKTPTYLLLHFRQKAYRVFLEDISAGGMALLLRKNSKRNAVLRPGSRVYISGLLTPEFSLLNLKGQIVYHKQIDPLLEKLGLRIFPQAKQAELLEKYLSNRKEEILVEINELYLGESQANGISNLYL